MRRIVWYDATLWLVLAAIGFLGPVAVGVVFRLALGAGLTLEWVTGGGQFAVSSAGLLFTTLYFVARPGLPSRLPFTEGFVIAFGIEFLAGITFFSLATLHLSEASIDPRYYQWPSIILFGVALVTAFGAVGLDKTRDIEGAAFLLDRSKAQLESTEAGFNATFREG